MPTAEQIQRAKAILAQFGPDHSVWLLGNPQSQILTILAHQMGISVDMAGTLVNAAGGYPAAPRQDNSSRIQSDVQRYITQGSRAWTNASAFYQFVHTIAGLHFRGNKGEALRAIQQYGGGQMIQQWRGVGIDGQSALAARNWDQSNPNGYGSPGQPQQPQQPPPGEQPPPGGQPPTGQPEGEQPFTPLFGNAGWNQYVGKLNPQQQALFQTDPRELWSRWMDTNPAVQGMNRYGRSAVNNLQGNLQNAWDLLNLGNLNPNDAEGNFGLQDFRSFLQGRGGQSGIPGRFDVMGFLRNNPFSGDNPQGGSVNSWLDDNAQNIFRNMLGTTTPRSISPYVNNALGRWFSGRYEDDPTWRPSEWLRDNNFKLPWS